jgi:hypothetical protein
MSLRQLNITDATIERYLAGALSDEAKASLEAAVASDAALRARVDALKAERAAFLAVDPPGAFAHRLMTRLEVAEAQTAKVPWWRTALVPMFATTAVILLGVGVLLNTQQSASPDAANIAAQHDSPPAAASPPPPAAASPSPAAATPSPAVAKVEAEVADKKEAPAAAGLAQPKADLAREPAPLRERATEKKASKPKESVMDPNDNRVSDALSRKAADDSLRDEGAGLGIGSVSSARRDYAKAPPAAAGDAGPPNDAAPPKGVAASAAPAKSAAPTAAVPIGPRSEEVALGYAETTAQGGAAADGAEAEDQPALLVSGGAGSTRARFSGQTLSLSRGQTLRVSGSYAAAHVALVSVDATGKLRTLYQGSGKNLSLTVPVRENVTLALLRSSQPLALDALAARAAKLRQQAMSLTFIPSGIEKRFVRLLVED